MGAIFKKSFTKPIPDDAELVTIDGKLFVRIKPSKGRAKTYPVTRSRDGSPRMLVTSSRYVAKYRDGHSVIRTVATGCHNEQAARSRLRELERRSELVRSGVISSTEDGIANQQSVPLSSHKDEYLNHLKSKGTSELHRRKLTARLVRLFDECGFRKLSDLSAERFEQWLLNAEELGLGARTRNTYRSALCAFCNWAVKSSRLSTNPVIDVSPANEKADRRHQRRSLTEIEIEQLLDTTERRPLLEALTVRRGKNIGKPLAKVKPSVRVRLLRLGKERRLIYLTLLSTGLRKSELASITVNQFHDEPSGAFIELHAGDEKNRQGVLIPIRPDLASQITAWIIETDPILADSGSHAENRRLFKVPAGLDKIFNKDIELAGIPKTDNRGYVADVHGLRTTFCSMLSKAGVQPKTVQLAMRHGSIDLTMETYTDPAILDLQGAIAALPLSGQIKPHQPALISEKPNQLAPELAPTLHNLHQMEHHAGDSSKFRDSPPGRPSIDVTSSPGTKKASPPFTDNEASEKRVRGIEPPLEAWEASVLPLNHTRQSLTHYLVRTFSCKEDVDAG